ncbi:YceI family protein [Flammeovirga yaeyamensis]|uniref:YceI family protein n=1 Tax=Flammeovirga yaeyamensis TaxID=367791 RepID=A0AAX1N4F6_9BACT|nr:MULTISPECIES: YceI family protein [Flammeovirga]ANQ50362.1 YceI family protein [Flammeovirga sp. MY04]MBB3699682.1 polyisoprenoid-binding protein YceI [Flammeovirga yaeyamensis]NMF36748.1 YceI family protein [Flammeovirga yaeyamensis]QWG02211.1 YceI family protein [Flammeovirga yaeyamensis]
MKTKIISTIVCILGIVASSYAQSSKNLVLGESKVVALGTSNTHDWEGDVKKMSGDASITIEDNQIKSIESLQVTMEVNSMESGKGSLDSNMHKTMNAKKHPKMTYKLTSASVDANGKVTAKGQLTINGTTKDITLNPVASLAGDKVTFKGETTFNMSAYGVEPPSLMFGAIKVEDEVKIEMNVVFN